MLFNISLINLGVFACFQPQPEVGVAVVSADEEGGVAEVVVALVVVEDKPLQLQTYHE